jgi:hypothetical protein
VVIKARVRILILCNLSRRSFKEQKDKRGLYSCPGPVKRIGCLHCPKTVAEKLSTPVPLGTDELGRNQGSHIEPLRKSLIEGVGHSVH